VHPTLLHLAGPGFLAFGEVSGHVGKGGVGDSGINDP
jgi:hypothetical protein